MSTAAEAPLYPLFLRLAGRSVLVVGGGAVAAEKAAALVGAGAVVTVVAPDLRPELRELASAVHQRGFCEADVDGAWLVIAAATPEVNRVVGQAALLRRTFIVAVDDIQSCTAFGAAQLRRGGLTVAISSDGRAPALVALLRRALESLLPDDIDAWVTLAERARVAWKEAGVPIERRRPLLLGALNALYPAAGSER